MAQHTKLPRRPIFALLLVFISSAFARLPTPSSSQTHTQLTQNPPKAPEVRLGRGNPTGHATSAPDGVPEVAGAPSRGAVTGRRTSLQEQSAPLQPEDASVQELDAEEKKDASEIPHLPKDMLQGKVQVDVSGAASVAASALPDKVTITNAAKVTVSAKAGAAKAAAARAAAARAAAARAAAAKAAAAKAAGSKGKAKGKAAPAKKPSGVTGNIPGKREWRGKSTPNDLKASTARVNLLLTILKSKGKYNTFIKNFQSTGVNNTIANILSFFGVTVLVPDDTAFRKVTAQQWAQVNSTPEGLLQLMAFHCMVPAYRAKDLTDAPPGSVFSTADYPQRGILAFKLKKAKSIPEFNGSPSQLTGALLVDNSIYYDSFGKNLLIAHGVNAVMFPKKFFQP